MKKNYLLVCLLLIASVSFSQTSKKNSLQYETPKDLMYDYKTQGSELFKHEPGVISKKNRFNTKAYLDTLAYEEFDTALNTASTIGKFRWRVTDVNNNGNIWESVTTAKTGIATGTIDDLNSTSASNGFISLPSDFYNSPRPVTLAQMETYITSGPIELSNTANSVLLQLQQRFAKCCFFADMMYLEVSADSVSWDTIPGVSASTPVGFLSANAAVETFNISEVARGEDTIYVRFRASRLSLWQWMIDDVTIIEGPKHDLELRDPRLLWNTDSFGITPSYRQIPYDLFTPMSLRASILNLGSDTARNTSFLSGVTRIQDLNGNPTGDDLFGESEAVPGLDPFPAGFVMTEDERFVPLLNGVFRAEFGVETDSVDQVPGNEADTLFFITSDTVFARDDGVFNPSTGISPVAISQGTSVGGYDGDAVGTMYILESRTQGNNVIPTSITFYVSDGEENIGISISPSIWLFDEDTNFAVNAWLPDDFLNNSGKGLLMFGNVYQVGASDTNSFLTLPLDTAGFAGLDSGQYMVGWEVISGSTVDRDVYFEVANDLSTAARQPGITSGLYHANTAPKNIIYNSATTQFQPVIRLNVGTAPIQTSINDLNNSTNQLFDVVPNPTKGELKINLMVEGQSTYSLNVRNLLGQVVYSDEITVNGTLTERLDLSSLEKGLYFVTLENAVERLQKKVILQ